MLRVPVRYTEAVVLCRLLSKLSKMSAGYSVEVVKQGSGDKPQKGQIVTVHYTGTLENGKQFDSSRDKGRKPLQFTVGAGQVIKGWDEVIKQMRVGECVKATISPDFAYGAKGAGKDIPPNATLIFDMELMSIKGGKKK